MRSAFFMLLAANLVFMAWAGWIDRPADSRLVEANNNLPRLRFSGEKPGAAATADQSAKRSRAPNADEDSGAQPGLNRRIPGRSNAEEAPPAVQPSRTSRGTTGTTNFRPMDMASMSGSLLAVAQATPSVARLAAADRRCLTVGPFKDAARSQRAIALLRERGFTPRQRAEDGNAWTGYWVYVGGLASEAEQADVLRRLESADIADAHSMPDTGEGLMVSVGLFSERPGAERRARSVQRLGVKADIMEKSQTGTLFWVNLDPDASSKPVPTEGLLALEEAGTRLEMKVCPRA